MAAYSGFEDFLSIDGVDVSDYIRDVELTNSMEPAETTAGSGVSNRTRNTGLKDNEISFTVIYDSAFIATMLPLVRTGEHTVIWGPEGNSSGQRKHEQTFIFGENVLSGNYEQSEVRVIPVSGVASAAPTSDIEAGATFS